MKTVFKTLVACMAFACIMTLTVGCASNPHKAEELDMSIKNETILSPASSIGVKEGNMIFQRKYKLGEELRAVEIQAYEAESTLYGGPRYYDNRGLIGVLKECRYEMAQMNDGKLLWSEKRDYVIPEYEDMQMGLDDKGKLAGLTEEFLKDRIERFKGYKDALVQRTEAMQLKIDMCQSELTFKKKSQERAIASVPSEE